MSDALFVLEVLLDRLETLQAWANLFAAERASAGPDSPRFSDGTAEEFASEAGRFCSEWWRTWEMFDNAPQMVKEQWQPRFTSVSARYRMVADAENLKRV